MLKTARVLTLVSGTVRRWRKRWLTSEWQAFEQRLSDAPRSGTPPTFAPGQICRIIALACAPPSEGGRTFTHWTHETLATAVRDEGIVTSISRHSVGRSLREAKVKPHRTRGWTNTPRDADFAANCQYVCETYRLSLERAAAGVETRSID